MIVPYFTFCVEVWVNTCKTYIDCILIFFRRKTFITVSGYRNNKNPIFTQLNLLKCHGLIELNILRLLRQLFLPIRFGKRESKYNLQGTEINKKTLLHKDAFKLNAFL